MQPIIPTKLKKGDTIRVIAPALSMSIISEDQRKYAKQYFENELGLKVTFSDHIEEPDSTNSSTVSSRIADLHAAFEDKEVKAIFSIIGGLNSNQLLKHIDWDLIRNNPKILCGFSDITALQNAIYAKTNLITYSGPHYSTLGQKHLDPYTLDYLKRCLFEDEAYEIQPSNEWTDDMWFQDQENRVPIKNSGFWMINTGNKSAKGTILGGNLSTMSLLQGTDFMPSASKIVLFIEDDSDTYLGMIDRYVQSLTQQPWFKNVQAIVLGRFQNNSEITQAQLVTMLKDNEAIGDIPVIANVDFGHTEPKITFPIGGEVQIQLNNDKAELKVTKH